MSSRVATRVAERAVPRVAVVRVLEFRAKRDVNAGVVARVRVVVVVRATTFACVVFAGSDERLTTFAVRAVVALRVTTFEALFVAVRDVVCWFWESVLCRVDTATVFVSRRDAARAASPISSACAPYNPRNARHPAKISPIFFILCN